MAMRANHCREFGPGLEPEYESDRLLVITLNTSRRYRHKQGEVSAVQIERAAARLEGSLLIDCACCGVERRDYNVAVREFAPVRKHDLPLGTAGHGS